MSIVVKLEDLRFGHEATPPINVRVVGRDAEVQELAASILAHGLIQALSVHDQGGVWFVADGNRRLAALRHLADNGDLPADWQVKCDPLTECQEAGEISLAANFERVPLHEADQYAKFHDLSERGYTDVQIASRFGIEPKRARRMMALGRLSPMLLDWWREQEQSEFVVNIVRAFTLAPSIEEQERVFERLNKSGNLHGYTIREAFGADDRDAARFLNFVGKKAYIAAGGEVVENLFGDSHALSDPALVARLADEKLRSEVEAIRKDGWAWADLDDDLPDAWRWSWQKLDLSKDAATEEDKQRSGAVVRLDYGGSMVVIYGVIRPAEAKPSTDKKDKDSSAQPATISNALSERLSVQATLAIRDALLQDPHAGIAALLAGFLAKYSGESPVKVSHSGMAQGPNAPLIKQETFVYAFDRLRRLSVDELLNVAAGVASEALDLTSYSLATRGLPAHRTLADALDGNNVYVALRQRFDFEDYFKSAPKGVVLKAIAEAINADESRKAGSLKKAELVEFALANVPHTGWLPPELRSASYPRGDIDEHGELVAS